MARKPKPQPPAESRMSYWLGRAARKWRDDARVTRRAITEIGNFESSTVRDFESGKTLVKDADYYIASYVKAIPDLDDGRLVWKMAIDDFLNRGKPLAFPFKQRELPEALAEAEQKASQARTRRREREASPARGARDRKRAGGRAA